jgi:serine/threonine protein kinase
MHSTEVNSTLCLHSRHAHILLFFSPIWKDIQWPEDPEEIPPDARNLIERLLESDPQKRLGTQGAEEIKKHPFFNGIAWETLYTQSMADVFIPKPADVLDTDYFGTPEHTTCFLSFCFHFTHTLPFARFFID